jgi:hypothetical protein
MKGTLLETRHWRNGDATTRFSDAEIIANMLEVNRFSATTVADFGFGQWHMAALAVQVDDPNPEIQAIVVQMLQEKEGARTRAEPSVPGAATGTASSNIHRTFDEWLAGYRGRLERFIKDAGRL